MGDPSKQVGHVALAHNVHLIGIESEIAEFGIVTLRQDGLLSSGRAQS